MSTGNDFGGHARTLCGNDAQRRQPAILESDSSRRSTVMRPGRQVPRVYKSDTASTIATPIHPPGPPNHIAPASAQPVTNASGFTAWCRAEAGRGDPEPINKG